MLRNKKIVLLVSLIILEIVVAGVTYVFSVHNRNSHCKIEVRSEYPGYTLQLVDPKGFESFLNTYGFNRICAAKKWRTLVITFTSKEQGMFRLLTRGSTGIVASYSYLPSGDTVYLTIHINPSLLATHTDLPHDVDALFHEYVKRFIADFMVLPKDRTTVFRDFPTQFFHITHIK